MVYYVSIETNMIFSQLSFHHDQSNLYEEILDAHGSLWPAYIWVYDLLTFDDQILLPVLQIKRCSSLMLRGQQQFGINDV